MQELFNQCGDQAEFSPEVLEALKQQNAYNIWVPKAFGGQELSLIDGLKVLQAFARVDGSLGWTVTLCSGANFFIGNLLPETARVIFSSPAILGGSGGLFGTAEKVGDTYRLSGKWKYATGAPYLTHFTLNAKIIEGGKELKNDDGSPKFLSFVIPAKEVTIINDWNTMGLKATATHSFVVCDVIVKSSYSFVYNTFYQPQPVFKIHFSIFADLTLWVNYIGMAEHFLAEVEKIGRSNKGSTLREVLAEANQKVYTFCNEIERIISHQGANSDFQILEIHEVASQSVRKISIAITEMFPYLGIGACRTDHPLNLIFRDFFTATQHHNFI